MATFREIIAGKLADHDARLTGLERRRSTDVT
jgi:hypothetical protein